MYKVLSIAGSDPSGGAGIQADLKTFSALKCFGMAVITALTAQNTLGVEACFNIPSHFIEQQLSTLFNDINPDAIKIGMLANSEIIYIISKFLKKHPQIPIILDPVMVATSGDVLLEQTAIDTLKTELMPLAKLITPNIHEAQILSNKKITNETDYFKVAQSIQNSVLSNKVAVLIKGGHSNNKSANDFLFINSNKYEWIYGKYINTNNTHGTGCTLSSAIACFIAQDNDITNACMKAKQYLNRIIFNSKHLKIGNGTGALKHFND